MKIHKDILIEDLLREHPRSVGFLMKKGIRCIACGEPVWGTLESAAREKGYHDDNIERMVVELVHFLKDDEKID